MRFKGTLVLLIALLALGSYIYFYEIKGGEKREKAKETEKQFWKVEDKDIQQIVLTSSGQKITAVRKSGGEWMLTTPRKLDADSDELNRIASSAADIQRESVVEQTSTDLAKFGLNPPRSGLKIITKNDKEYSLNFGNKNPTGSFAYASIPGQKEVFLIPTQSVDAFNKNVDDLRNHTVLSFKQPEVLSLSIKNPKGTIELVKDKDDRWWFKEAGARAADSPKVRGILNALSMEKIASFFDENPKDYSNLDLDKPLIEVTVAFGKEKASERLSIFEEKSRLRRKQGKGREKTDNSQKDSSETYLAQNASRPDLFFVGKDFVDKLLIAPDDIRDKALASIQRWDVDSIILTNSKGSFVFKKTAGEWFMEDGKKKAKWDAVNGILDAMEKPVKEWIDNPGSLSTYGLDKPSIHIVLKQGSNVIADCSFGKATKKGIYAQVKGDASVKIADPERLAILDEGGADYEEAPPASAPKK